MELLIRVVIAALLLLGTAGCAKHSPADAAAPESCPVTEPVRATPPADSAVQGDPVEGVYFVNEARSLWASASWTTVEAQPTRLLDEGVKVGWFRPEGATLQIAGRRLDGQAPPLEAHVPCCYPTRFQATGLMFPTAGCWEVSATAADQALSFVVEIAP